MPGTLGWAGVSHAQPVTNRVLSGYQIASGGGCSIYKINFNFRIRYDSHFPVTSGNQLRILFRPVDPREFVIQGGYEREALRPPQDRHTAIKAIEYETRIAESPALTIVFDRNVHFSAAWRNGFPKPCRFGWRHEERQALQARVSHFGRGQRLGRHDQRRYRKHARKAR